MAKLIIVLGFALFAMFFGAGNLIFPPTLGRMAGDDFVLAMLGFVLTGVGLPFLGVLAVAKSEGGIEHMARRVHPKFAMVLTTVMILAIGPLLAIPRTCATTYELGMQPLVPWMNSWAFSALYFAAVLFFALNPLSVVDRIGKILTPLLLASLFIIIIAGILHPLGAIGAGTLPHAFGKGFVEGYQTMDLIAAVIFGIIMYNDIRSKGFYEKSKQLKIIILAGCISTGGLALVYAGLVYVGATTMGIAGEFTRTGLLNYVSNQLLGVWGSATLAMAVAMACLTTAIGLVVMSGEYFNKLTHGRLNYRFVCIAVSLVSLVFANAGVEQIIKVAVPPLVALYPVVMVLVILTLIGGRIQNRNVWRGAVLGAFAVGVMESIHAMGIKMPASERMYDVLPFTQHGLGWVVPAVALGLLGALLRPRTRPVFRVLAISPSSSGTLIALFDNEVPLFEKFIPHTPATFAESKPAVQGALIMEEVLTVMRQEKLLQQKIDAVAGRGGFTKPLPSGVYRISPKMLEDLSGGAYGAHASNWGAFVAQHLGHAMGVPAYMVDPVVVDEMCLHARITGLPEFRRRSVFHAPIHKAVVRNVAKQIWSRPEKINVVVAHMGDGISVGAHQRGRAIDVNNALDGDGPFSSNAAGTLPSGDLIRLCFGGTATREQMLYRISEEAGLKAHLGTTSITEIEQRIDEGDEKALLVLEAMAYQVAKSIGECAAALKGRVDAIALSGEFVASRRFVGWIEERVRFIARVFIYPKENEALAIAKGTLRVLQGDAEVREYLTHGHQQP